MATQSSYKGYFYHPPIPEVEKEIRAREVAYSAKYRGHPDSGSLAFPYMKTAYMDIYAYCPETETQKESMEELMGSSLARKKVNFDGNSRKGQSSYHSGLESGQVFWETSGSRVLRPTIPLVQSVNISSEGRVGSLQKVKVQFKLWDREQLDEYEKQIMQPGKDLLIAYGWSTSTKPSIEERLKRERTQKTKRPEETLSATAGLGDSQVCNHDLFTGIVSNFGWSMNSDLSYDCNVELTGKGFLLAGIAANAPQAKEKKVEEIEDENGVKIFVDNLVTKLQADVEQLSTQVGNVSTPKVYEGTSAGVPMKYGVLELKYNPSDEAIDVNEEGEAVSADIPEEAKGKETKIFYVPLKDILKYFNLQVLSQTPRTISKDPKRAQLYLSADPIEQVEYLVDGVQSVTLYDPHIASADPATILFNGGRDGGNKHSANYSKDFSSGYYKSGNYRIHGNGKNHCEFQYYNTDIIADAADIGNILISTNFLEDSLNELGDEKEPINQGIMNLCNKLFTQIAWCSGNIYQLTFVEMKSTSGGTWNVVVDKNYIPGEGIEPLRFEIRDPNKALLRSVNISSTIPSGQGVALYAAGRSEITDGNFPSAGKIVDDGCEMKSAIPSSAFVSQRDDPPEAVEKPPHEQLNDLKGQLAKVGSIHFTRQQLHQVLKKFKSDGFRVAPNSENRYKFMTRDLYPINLSLELDGIVGFAFGDALQLDDVLPERYRSGNVIFIITKISHSISPNIWTTNIEVQCRPEV